MKKILVFLMFLMMLCSPVFAGSVGPSGVTVQDIIDRVRYELNETSDSGTTLFWSDTELIQWTNEAVKEINIETGCLEAGVSTFTIVENDRDYAISGVSFTYVVKVEYDFGLSGATTRKSQIIDLDRVPFKDLRYGKGKEIGDPKAFSVWNDTLYIWPIPRSTQAGNTLNLFYVSKPDEITTASAAIPTPEELDTAILYYVRFKAHGKEQNDTRAHYYRQLFGLELQSYMRNIQRRE